MSNQEKKIVEDYKRILGSVISAPHLTEAEGIWYHFYHPMWDEHYIKMVGEDGQVRWEEETLEDYRKDGWAVTPVIAYKVDTSKVR